MGGAAKTDITSYMDTVHEAVCKVQAAFICTNQRRDFHMKEFWNTIQFIFTAIGGWLGYFLGGCDGLLIALIIFVVCDYITGIMCAIADKKLSSESALRASAERC